MKHLQSCSIFLITLLPIVLGQGGQGNNPERGKSNVCRGKTDGALYPHEEYCDYYYECDANGDSYLQACPNGLAFAGNRRGLVGNCDYPFRVGCPDSTRVMGQQAQASDNCGWSYGVYPHATSCTRYWHCWNGTATIQQCPFSLLYNDATHSCDWPNNVPDCQKHPICKDVPTGPVGIEKSCVRYWLCVGGYPRLQRCPAGLAFDTNISRCELAQNVPGCEPPPTTPTPPEDDDREDDRPSGGNQGGRQNSRPNQGGNNPPQYRPSQPGVRLAGRN